MKRVRGVIVDWAGTIVDFGSCAPVRAFVEVFRGMGVDIGVEEARAPMGMAKRDHIAAIARMPQVVERSRAALGRPLGEADIDALYRDFIPAQLRVLAEHAAPIPGAPAALAAWRNAGLRVGSTTGYSREMMDLLVPLAHSAGVSPDCVVTASDVRAGRPAPWMALEAAARLDVYPMAALVKIGDTVADIDEGRNAGMWTIGVTATGNELGLDEREAAALSPEARASRIESAGRRLLAAGAHAVADSVADCAPLFVEFEARLERGERP